MPVSRGRKPKRPTKNPHRSGRPRREPDVAGSLMKVLAALDDPLDAELLVSDAFGLAYEGQQADDKNEIVEVLATVLLEAAAVAEQPGALELLAVLGTVGPDSVSARARVMVEVRRAAEPDLEHQPWVTTLEPLRCTTALAMQDAFGDSTEYLVAFARGDKAHALLWLVDNNVGHGFARDVLVASDADEVEQQLRELAAGEDVIPVTVNEIDLALLHGRLRAAMDLETMTIGPPDEESYARTRMLAYGRLRSLPDPVVEDVPTPTGEAERDRIVADFLMSPELRAFPDDLKETDEVGHLVKLVVDFAVDVIGGSPYRFTPSTAEMLLMDWVPDNAQLDERDVHLLPIVMEAWASYALRIEPLGPVDVVVDTISELATEFDDLMDLGD